MRGLIAAFLALSATGRIAGASQRARLGGTTKKQTGKTTVTTV